jgi:hypothetical protein
MAAKLARLAAKAVFDPPSHTQRVGVDPGGVLRKVRAGIDPRRLILVVTA